MAKDGGDAEEQRKQRAAARGGWPIRVGALQDPVEDDLSATTTLQERLAMVWRLTLDAWASSGRPIPSYSRSDMPGRVTVLRDE
jgi:hypothetical protein